MTIRLAFAGFRHAHILDVYDLAGENPDVRIVAACEEDPATREALQAGGKVKLTHDTYDRMFAEADFDALAVGDYYARRGEIIIRALHAGKHVISDKPICTRLDELDRIAALARRANLSVGCQLSMRDEGNYIALRQVVREGLIGPIHTVSFSGQHPLLRGVRPDWYFEPGKHGGTINDIAVHALDAIPWMTGRRIAAIVAARAWNARAEPRWFQDGAQLMLRLDGDAGAIGDVSYLAPDACGYKVPQYWRFTLHGTDGLAETASSADGVTVYRRDDPSPRHVPPAPATPGGYFDSFLRELSRREGNLTPTTREANAAGRARPTTREVLESSRVALLAQHAADHNLRDVPCE